MAPAEWVAEVARGALSVEPDRSDERLSVVVADDESVAELNRRHRGLDEITDVLSFSNVHAGTYYGTEHPETADDRSMEFVLPPGQQPDIGEVIISYRQAVRQAREAGHTDLRELATLIAHGIFHLLGYDHEEDGEAQVMRSREQAAMAELVSRGLLARGPRSART